MSAGLETTEQGISRAAQLSSDGGASDPGLILVFSGGEAMARVLPIKGAIEIGRNDPIFGEQVDGRISRKHARITVEGRDFVAWDLDSRNGTCVDGFLLEPGKSRKVTRFVRLGDSVFLPCRDSALVARLGVRCVGGRVEGPALQEAALAVEKAAQGRTLLIVGESGAGKEALARAFHASGPNPTGPFIAVNCAAIPEGVAERLLFGAKRGAFSDANADADGYVQAANGGTLFLDEVAELDERVQAKLLRVLDAGEVMQLGASRPRAVNFRFCSATHRDLRALAATGRMREDLYHRIAHPRVVVPPLRDRPEEIPWLLQSQVSASEYNLALHVSLVETCLLRSWPGNVRELLAEARAAAQVAQLARQPRVEGYHLADKAGAMFSSDSAAMPTRSKAPDMVEIQRVLAACDGNVSAAARTLGVHRTQLRRWLARLDGDDTKPPSEPGAPLPLPSPIRRP